jgi:hypothetical protein
MIGKTNPPVHASLAIIAINKVFFTKYNNNKMIIYHSIKVTTMENLVQ